MKIYLGFLWALLCGFWQETVAQSHTNFVIKQIEKCIKTSPVLYDMKLINQDGQQYLDFNLTSPIALDNNIGYVCDIQKKIGNTFLPLFTIREKDFCKACNMYAGELWYDMERAAQLIPGRCPIPAGRYHVHHMLVDTRKMTLQTFPFGTLRFILKGIDKVYNQDVFCIKIEVENVNS